MQAKNKTVSATLTDVKNKTGDVFSLADKHGSVVITSYNKPKYIISKYKPTDESMVVEPSLPIKTQEKVPMDEPIVMSAPPKLPPLPEPEPSITAVKEVAAPATEEPVTQIKEEENPVLAAPAQELAEVPTKPEQPAPEVAKEDVPTSGSAVFTISAKDGIKETALTPEITEEKIAEPPKPEQPRQNPLGGLLGIFSRDDSWDRNNNRELNWTKKAQDLLN